MIVWVLYDIKDNKSRTKIAKICKQSGLYRVQLSVFIGSIEAYEKDTLRLQFEDIIDEETDKIYIFPMNKAELKQTELLGQAFDKRLITNKVRELFL